MLNHNDAFGFSELLDDANNSHSLVNVEVGRGFVEEIHVDIPQDGCTNRHPLQFTPGQLLDGALEQVVNAQRLGHGVQHASLINLGQEFTNRALHTLWQLVHVLWLDGHFDLAFLHSDEEITQFTLW